MIVQYFYCSLLFKAAILSKNAEVITVKVYMD